MYVWTPPGLEVKKKIRSEQFLIKFEKTDPFTRVQDVYGSYPALGFRVHLTRRMSYMLLQVYIPSGLFVVVSFVSLVVPPEVIPGRVTLCITTILTMSALLGVTMQSTPLVSYVRAIDVWLLSCLTFVTLVLLEFGLVIRLQELGKPRTVNSRMCKKKTTFITTKVASIMPESHPSVDTTTSPESVYLLRARQVESVASWGFPVSFILFNLSYWCWFMFGSAAAIPNLTNNTNYTI